MVSVYPLDPEVVLAVPVVQHTGTVTRVGEDTQTSVVHSPARTADRRCVSR